MTKFRNWIQILSLILLLSVPTLAAVPDSNSCFYYLDKEKETGCWFRDKESTDYLVKYGYKYCSIFKNKSSLWQDARSPWIKATTLCLQNNLEKMRPPVNCPKLETLAFHSHSQCYSESNFCELNRLQKTAIAWTIISVDLLLKPKNSFFQALQVFKDCLHELPAETAELRELALQISEKYPENVQVLEKIFNIDGLKESQLSDYSKKILSTFHLSLQKKDVGFSNLSQEIFRFKKELSAQK